MAGYGLPENEHLSFQLERDLELYYTLDTNVINGSVSGDTSSSGLNRLEWTLPDKIAILSNSLNKMNSERRNNIFKKAKVFINEKTGSID